ncbi:MAG: hypothetical protein U0457_10250 [Candidatus Sericytochromatia bacterium]
MCFPKLGTYTPVKDATAYKTENTVKTPTVVTPDVSKVTETKVPEEPKKDTAEIKTKLPTTAPKITNTVSPNIGNLIQTGLANKNLTNQAAPQKSTEISPTGATEYSKEETRKVIKAAEKYGKDLFPKNPVAAADAAWGWALDKRNKVPKDVNWAAAEHYLYAKARGKESKVEAVTMGVLAAGYDVAKAALFAVGKEEWLATDGKKDSISKPTLGSTISGIEGAIDSFKD